MSKLSDLEEELAVQAGMLLEAKLELDRNARRVKRLEAEFREVERKIRDEHKYWNIIRSGWIFYNPRV